MFQASRRGVRAAMLRHRRCGPQLAARSSLTVARSRGTPKGRCNVALPSLACVSAVLWRAKSCSLESPQAVPPPAAAGPEPFDVWFADDGQGYMRPAMLQEYLHTLDDEAAKVGAVRSAGDAAKSTAVLVGHPAALAAFEAEQQQLRQQQPPTWDSLSVRRACRVLEPNAPLEVLGAVIGDAEEVHRQFDAHLDKLAILHATIANLEDAATELTLSRVRWPQQGQRYASCLGRHPAHHAH